MSTNNLTEFKDRIKLARESTGLSRDALGKRLKVSGAYIGQLESGKKVNPSDLFLNSICNELKVNLVWLKAGKGEMKPQCGSVIEEQSPYNSPDQQIIEMISIMKSLDQVAKEDLLRQARKDLELMLMKQKDQVKEGLIDALEQCTARLPKPPDLSSEPTAEKRISKVTSIISSESIEKLP